MFGDHGGLVSEVVAKDEDCTLFRRKSAERAIHDVPIDDTRELVRLVGSAPVGDTAAMEVLRDGERHSVAIKVLRPNVASRFRRDLSDFFFVAQTQHVHINWLALC